MKRFRHPWIDPFVYLLIAMMLGFMCGFLYAQAKCKTNLHDLQMEMLETQVQGCEEVVEEIIEEVLEPTNAQVRPVSAYTSRVEETDSTPCVSASGANICHLYYEDGTRICAMNDVPFGTILEIEGYGTCAVYDRMASHKDGWVDIYMGYDLEGALEWGVRNVTVSEIK